MQSWKTVFLWKINEHYYLWKGKVLLTVDGGVFALFTSYMDHGNVATKIRTGFIAFFMVADKILFIYFI